MTTTQIELDLIHRYIEPSPSHPGGSMSANSGAGIAAFISAGGTSVRACAKRRTVARMAEGAAWQIGHSKAPGEAMEPALASAVAACARLIAAPWGASPALSIVNATSSDAEPTAVAIAHGATDLLSDEAIMLSSMRRRQATAPFASPQSEFPAVV